MQIISAKRGKLQHFKRVPFVNSGSAVKICSTSETAAAHLTAALAAVVQVGKCVEFRCECNFSAVLFIDERAFFADRLTQEVAQLARAKGTCKRDWRNGKVKSVVLDPCVDDVYSSVAKELEESAPDVAIFAVSYDRLYNLRDLQQYTKTACVFVCAYDREDFPLLKDLLSEDTTTPYYWLTHNEEHSQPSGAVSWSKGLFEFYPVNTAAKAVGVHCYFKLGSKSKTPYKISPRELSLRCYVGSYHNKYNEPMPLDNKDRRRVFEAKKLGLVTIDIAEDTFSFIHNKINDNILRTITYRRKKKQA